ncbi:helix-turn-helix domain-containing protein [Paenibacillus odorifer]|uniref:helix-turn-helix domain-containing protein n=1 Tax=Paenibacillus odorifer TaxID=189426 RepID=UPI0028A2124C|nr:AraC family transcriptional regulator [Paenibacillus odorifer]
MKSGEADWYDIESLKPQHHALAEGLNGLYRPQSTKNKLQIPEQFGQGYWERIKVSSAIEITVCEMYFHDNVEMRSSEQKGSFKWSYCLGAPIEWQVRTSKRDYRLNHGELSVFGHQPADCIGIYQAGIPYYGITVKADPHLFEPVRNLSSLAGRQEPFQTHIATPLMQQIFLEMLRCSFEDRLKRIYLEGKVMELTAVYMHEALGKPAVRAALSRTDVDSLFRAKEILDHDLLAAPGIQELSMRVCLNEYKLKKGFKELFGMPVHAYLIDSRLKAAHRLLEDGSITVTAAAVMTGFSNPSFFAEKFRQKYGSAPSRYFGRA